LEFDDCNNQDNFSEFQTWQTDDYNQKCNLSDSDCKELVPDALKMFACWRLPIKAASMTPNVLFKAD